MKRYGDVRRLHWRGRISEHYFVRIVDSVTGKSTWKSTGFRDSELALAIVHRWQLEEITDGGPQTQEDARISDALASWEQQVTLGRSANYAAGIRSLVRMWTRSFGALSVRAMTDIQITAYVAERIGQSRKPKTINQELKCMRAFFRWCVDRGWTARNPVTRTLRIPECVPQPRVLTDDEEERLLYAAHLHSPRVYGYVLILLTTGFRAHLAEVIRWEHVDLDTGTWRIPAELMKSRREYRAAVAPRLLAWLRRQERDGRAIIGGVMAYHWRRLREAVGMPTLKRHDLRRSFVTRCRQAGVKLEVAMALADHVSTQTMMASYRKVDVAETLDALQTMDAQRRDHA